MLKKNNFLIFFFICFLILSPSDVSGAVLEKIPRLGVWITAFSEEEVLLSKENVNRLVRTCKETGIKDIYIQIYRADRAYYDSDITDRTGYEKILSEAGEDTLSYLIKTAKNNGLKVYAWINLLSVARNENANILKTFGKEILAIDQYGRSAMLEGEKDELDKYYIRENQLFLEPGDRRVKEYLTNIAEEIVTKYPGLSGLHFDYIRYPAAVPFSPGAKFASHGITYGYSEPNIRNFKNATGVDLKTGGLSRAHSRLWDDWRRDNVTSLLRNICNRVRALSPSLRISCTIVPSMERTYLTTFQDWTEWLRAGYVDYVVAMNYTDDTKLMKLRTRSLLLPGLDDNVHIGVGAYLLKDKPEIFSAQIRALRKLSPAGIVIFSYDEIAGDRKIRQSLSENFKGRPAVSTPTK